MTETTVNLNVEGMHCESCATKLRKAIASLKGVMEVQVFLEQKTAVIRFESERVDERRIRRAIGKAGYIAGELLP